MKNLCEYHNLHALIQVRDISARGQGARGSVKDSLDI